MPFTHAQLNHDTGYRMTCKEMLQKSKNVAANLVKLGVKVGDYVTIVSEQHDDLASIVIGALACGAVVNALHTSFTISECIRPNVKHLNNHANCPNFQPNTIVSLHWSSQR